MRRSVGVRYISNRVRPLGKAGDWCYRCAPTRERVRLRGGAAVRLAAWSRGRNRSTRRVYDAVKTASITPPRDSRQQHNVSNRDPRSAKESSGRPTTETGGLFVTLTHLQTRLSSTQPRANSEGAGAKGTGRLHHSPLRSGPITLFSRSLILISYVICTGPDWISDRSAVSPLIP